MMELIRHEDEDLLVIGKPAGWNTHAPGPYANEGVYDWLKNREARWGRLAIVHRLDKETSGLLVFGKTPLANRDLSRQFEGRLVRKKYLFLTASRSGRREFTARGGLKRAGEKYVTAARGGDFAETHFRRVEAQDGKELWEAEPRTGRTHQIRVQAAEHGLPILGDALYGGEPAARVCLHAAELGFTHPASGKPLTFCEAPDFSIPTYKSLRQALIEPQETNAFRLVHGAADGWPGLYVDKLGEYLLAASERELTSEETVFLRGISARAVFFKRLERQPAGGSPRLLWGEAKGISLRENGISYEIRMSEGYSVGLFLDQRDNRRRLLTGQIAAGFDFAPPKDVLNTFAYTCSFSVCAAARGARTASVDLSRKYLDWGRENFRVNNLKADEHEFLTGDVFDWLKRLGRKKRVFDLVILDPPTFSRSKESGVFQAGKDYGRLAEAAMTLVKPGGLLFASTNAATYPPAQFLEDVAKAAVKRRIWQEHYSPQPPDFPIHRLEPAYLKTIWLRLE